jgi:hypothetical protein
MYTYMHTLIRIVKINNEQIFSYLWYNWTRHAASTLLASKIFSAYFQMQWIALRGF